MAKFTITIELDTANRQVQLTGPLNDPMLMHWGLQEAARKLNEYTCQKEQAAPKGPQLVVVGADALPPS